MWPYNSPCMSIYVHGKFLVASPFLHVLYDNQFFSLVTSLSNSTGQQRKRWTEADKSSKDSGRVDKEHM